MKDHHKLLAEKLLHISAIKLQPEAPFIWGSGWTSPIYTDIRRTLSYPDIRNFLKIELSRLIIEHFPEVNAIAGVATGAIAIGGIVADALSLPYAYVRNRPKDHGLENLIEGNLKIGWKVVVIDELISTGAAAIKCVDAIANAGCEPVGLCTVFDFEFPEAIKRFNDANIPLLSLLTYTEMLEVASRINYINPAELEALQQWRKDPTAWSPESL